MGNPFYNRFNNNNQFNTGPLGQLMNLKQQFNAFRQQFQGDPQQQVQQLLDSGQMTQEQFNKLSNMAKMYQSLFNGGN